ncbi:hypothetical protein SAMN05216486_10824 [bacterium JGI 053]|nr:hypothetical protein SAMN05216486_10824 [bacterium JGI 053]
MSTAPRRRAALALVVLALVCVGGPARRKASVARGAPPAAGEAARLPPLVGRARAGEVESRTLRLQGGTAYRISGMCDTNCADLDLLLYSGDSVVAEDVGPTETPVIRYAPARSGSVTLRVHAARCKEASCGFKVSVRGAPRRAAERDTNPRLMGMAPEPSAKLPEPVPAALADPPAGPRLEPAVRRSGCGSPNEIVALDAGGGATCRGGAKSAAPAPVPD